MRNTLAKLTADFAKTMRKMANDPALRDDKSVNIFKQSELDTWFERCTSSLPSLLRFLKFQRKHKRLLRTAFKLQNTTLGSKSQRTVPTEGVRVSMNQKSREYAMLLQDLPSSLRVALDLQATLPPPLPLLFFHLLTATNHNL